MKMLFGHPDSSESLAEIELHPTKIIGVGRNFGAHAREMGKEPPGEPLVFLKPVSSVIAHDQAIVRPKEFERVDYEGELALVISRRASQIQAKDAASYILGYTCANDITVRALQKDGPWMRAKGMDTFCPLGPVLVPALDPTALTLQLRVNGDVRQSANTNQMIFTVGEVLEFISKEITLEAHDIVLMGTPEGVGNLAEGDVVEVEIGGIGVLRNSVVGRQDIS